MQLCAYRVVQEALTNVIKHAGLVTTNVMVRCENNELTVRIRNQPGTVPDDGPSAGHGLINMQERAALYQGTLSAGPRDDGAFVVELTMPVNEDRPADGPETKISTI
jgi:signal transduction histidine kinase